MHLLTLHVGSHKTATTSVQRWLLRHRAALAGQGVDYPNLRELVPTAVDFTQWDLVAALAGDPSASRLGREGLDIVLGHLAVSEAPHLLLSAENCWGLPPRGPDYFATKAEFADRLVGTLRQVTGRDVRVVAWVRRPDLYLRSLFNQAVKQLTWSSDADDIRGWFADFAAQHLHLAQYDRHLDVWAQTVGDEATVFRHFAPSELVGGDPVLDFCQLVGIDPEGLSILGDRENESWSVAALQVKHEVNRLASSPRDARRARRVLEEALGPSLHARDLAAALGADAARRLQEQLMPDLTRTTARLGHPDSWTRAWGEEVPASPSDAAGPAHVAARVILQQLGLQVDDAP